MEGLAEQSMGSQNKGNKVLMRTVEKKQVSKCCKCQLQAYVLHLLKQEVKLRKPISMGKTVTVKSGLSSSHGRHHHIFTHSDVSFSSKIARSHTANTCIY